MQKIDIQFCDIKENGNSICILREILTTTDLYFSIFPKEILVNIKNNESNSNNFDFDMCCQSYRSCFVIINISRNF